MLWPCFEYKIAYRDSQLKFITDDEAKQMIALYKEGCKMQDIAHQFLCSVSVVSSMLRGIRKKHLGQSSKLALNNKSGHEGVCYEKGRRKWRAYTRKDGKRVNLGRFDTLEEAIARQELEIL